MSTLKCCVGGCDSTKDTHRLFCLPKIEWLRNFWMSVLIPTNSRLIGLSESQLYNKRVCEKHFDKAQFDREGKRIRYSYPCLFTEKEFLHGVPLSTIGELHEDHNYCKSSAADEDEPPTLDASVVPQNEIFSWQKNVEDVLKFDDEITADDNQDNFSLYCKEEDNRPTVIKSHDKTHDNHLNHQYMCNFCSESITGFRYRCVQCADCDLCARCEATGCHAEHYVLRIPPDRPHAEMQSVLSRIRGQLLDGGTTLLTGDVTNDLLVDGIKVEVKEEEEQCDTDPLRLEEAHQQAESVDNKDAVITIMEQPAVAPDVPEHNTPPVKRLLCRVKKRSVSPQQCSEDDLYEVPVVSDLLRPQVSPLSNHNTSLKKRKKKDTQTSCNPQRQFKTEPVYITTRHPQPLRTKKLQFMKAVPNLKVPCGSKVVKLFKVQQPTGEAILSRHLSDSVKI